MRPVATTANAAAAVAKRTRVRRRGGAAAFTGPGGAAVAWGGFASGDRLTIDSRRPGFRLAANGSKLPKGDAAGHFERTGRKVGRFDGMADDWVGLDGIGARGCIQIVLNGA